MSAAPFTFGGFRRGLRDRLPLGLSIFAYGLGFGLVAAQAGFGVAKAVAAALLGVVIVAAFRWLGL